MGSFAFLPGLYAMLLFVKELGYNLTTMCSALVDKNPNPFCFTTLSYFSHVVLKMLLAELIMLTYQHMFANLSIYFPIYFFSETLSKLFSQANSDMSQQRTIPSFADDAYQIIVSWIS